MKRIQTEAEYQTELAKMTAELEAKHRSRLAESEAKLKEAARAYQGYLTRAALDKLAAEMGVLETSRDRFVDAWAGRFKIGSDETTLSFLREDGKASSYTLPEAFNLEIRAREPWWFPSDDSPEPATGGNLKPWQITHENAKDVWKYRRVRDEAQRLRRSVEIVDQPARTKTMKRAAFEQMSPGDRLRVVRSGTQIID